MTKKKKKFVDNEELLRKAISKFNKLPGVPKQKARKVNINTNSWFTASSLKVENGSMDAENSQTNANTFTRCDKIVLRFTKKQRAIIRKWFIADTFMYNETLKYFRGLIKLRGNDCGKLTKKDCNMIRIRDVVLVNSLKYLIEKYKVPRKILVGSISRACDMAKSCITNYKNGHTKKFRLRPLKHTRKKKVISIQKDSFSKTTKNLIFGTYIKTQIKTTRKGFLFNTIKKDSILHFNSTTRKYTLLVPRDGISKQTKTKNTVSIDPGVRTFLTCLANDKITELGKNIREKIGSLLTEVNKLKAINTKTLVSKQNNGRKPRIKRLVLKLRKKIEGLINELHWKVIDHLVKNYRTIIIGKWSTVLKNKQNVYFLITTRGVLKIVVPKLEI